MNLKRYVIFLLDKEVGKPDGKLRIRIKWTGGIVAFSLGYRVEFSKWSQDTQRCRMSTTHGKKKIQANVINREIQRFSDTADTVFDAFEKFDTIPSPSQIRDAFNLSIGKTPQITATPDSNSLYKYFDLFVSTMGSQNGWSNETFTKFSAIKKHLTAFDPELSFASLSDQLMHSFVQHLHKENLRNTTISKNIAFVRWFLRWAYNKEHYSGRVHETFRPKLKGTDGNSKEVIHLTWDELQHLLNYEVPEPKQYLARVRDVFCFCCFTGLRYSDVFKLSRSDIRSTYITIVTKKTSDALQIELNKYSRAILEKYVDFPFPGNKALPVVSNVNMNIYLKELGELAKLKEPQRIVYFMGNVRHEEVFPKYSLLTTHCGRRTFIVNALFLGIPSDVVMKWTGHSDHKAMRPYVKIVDQLKAQEMAKFDR